jgi:hypothetical protein
MESEIRRLGPFLEVVDSEGRRHLFRASSNVEISDTDSLRNESLITIGGRSFMVLRPYDEIVEALLEGVRP